MVAGVVKLMAWGCGVWRVAGDVSVLAACTGLKELGLGNTQVTGACVRLVWVEAAGVVRSGVV